MSDERLGLDDLAALEEQRRFLLRSLEDLERERDAGDIDDDDYRTLEADYTHRAAEVIRAIEGQRELHRATRPDRGVARKVIAGVAVAIVAVVLGLVVAATSGEQGRRQAEGGMDLVPSDAVEACIAQMNGAFAPAAQGGQNDDLAADALATLECFTTEIDADPDDAVAYTYRGWTLALLARQIDGVATAEQVASFVQRSQSDLAEARALAPRYPDALTFSAIVAVWTTDVDAAEDYLAQIDALPLPANAPILASVNQMLRPLVRAATEEPASSTTEAATDAPATSSSPDDRVTTAPPTSTSP